MLTRPAKRDPAINGVSPQSFDWRPRIHPRGFQFQFQPYRRLGRIVLHSRRCRRSKIAVIGVTSSHPVNQAGTRHATRTGTLTIQGARPAADLTMLCPLCGVRGWSRLDARIMNYDAAISENLTNSAPHQRILARHSRGMTK